MALYSTTSKMKGEQVLQRALSYFGPEALGLTVSDHGPCCVTFVGGGGHVSIATLEKGGKTEVELETREWDYHVKEFMHEIAW